MVCRAVALHGSRPSLVSQGRCGVCRRRGCVAWLVRSEVVLACTALTFRLTRRCTRRATAGFASLSPRVNSNVSLRMKEIINVVRALVALVVAVFVASILASLSVEAVVVLYMQHYGVAHRADLSDDMGFGMLGLFVQSLVALLSFVVMLIICWRLSARVVVAAGLTDSSSGPPSAAAEQKR